MRQNLLHKCYYITTEHYASSVVVGFLLVLPFRERTNFNGLVKNILLYWLHLHKFLTQNNTFFKISVSGLFLKYS